MNRQWLFAEAPDGKIATHHFKQVEAPIPEPSKGEVLVQHLYLSLIPANRAWMNGETYRKKLNPGQVMPGLALGRVVKSRNPAYPEGQLVETTKGWQDFAVCRPDQIVVRNQERPPEHLLGILGTNAVTAFFGLLQVGKPRAGENLLISAAAGGIGSIVAQIGQIAGCRVTGIAGGEAKCAWLRDTVGLDAAVDYKSPNFLDVLSKAAEMMSICFSTTPAAPYSKLH